MLKMFQLLFLFLCLLEVKVVTAPKKLKPPPLNPRWRWWNGNIINIHLTNMTEELLKDTKLKLEQVKQIQISYMHTMAYDLGTITSYIQEDFAHMLAIYREYADLKNFVNENHTLHEILQAYHIIQGDYNKIRLGKNQFYEVLQKHQDMQKERLQYLESRFGPIPHNMKKTFRTNSTILDQKERRMDSINDLQKATHMKSLRFDGQPPPQRMSMKTKHKRLWRPRDKLSNF